MVDIDQEVNQAGEEEEDRYMEKGREGLDSNWKTESFDISCEEGSDPSTIVGSVPTLRGLETSARTVNVSTVISQLR